MDKKVDGLLVIPESLKVGRKIYFFALNISDFALVQYLTSSVQKILSRKILTDKGYNIEVVEEAIRDVSLSTFKVKKEGITKSTSGMDYMMSIFMLTILFMVIMLYGQLIMRGIIEEKNDRIIEILISSTNAHTLYFGKIIGVGLAGLTQILIWIVLAILALSQFPQAISPSLLGFLTPELAVYFIIFFIIGYYMYSILFSIVGAAVNTDQEAQQYAGPIITIMFIPFLIGIMVTQNPNTLVVLITSLFPLFTPTLMFMRISVAVPPLSQILVSILLSILTTFFLAWLGAKIFRTGILMYGKKPSVKEIFKWIRYK
jgi:ABC-2 type transport system permease protein